MKLFTLALKDLLRAFRSRIAIAFMFAMPILITGIIYFAFSGLADEEETFSLPVTEVIIFNQDQPQSDLGGISAGQLLVDFLKEEDLSDIINAVETESEAIARSAVDNQEAGVAIIIPTDFTRSAFDTSGSVSIVLYQDPTLTIGPAIVKSLVSQFVDGFSGSIIASQVTMDQLSSHGESVSPFIIQEVAQKYALWAQSAGEAQSSGNIPGLSVETTSGEEEAFDFAAEVLPSIMLGMAIFFAFFTGANVAQYLLREDEEGTLQRLFTTPTPRSIIIGGNFLAVFLITTIQVLVIITASGIIFNIRWGDPGLIAIAIVSLVISAGCLGIMLMSFVSNTRQAGALMGFFLTITGMAGGLFTVGFPVLPAAFDTIKLFTPQGWILNIWTVGMEGGEYADLLIPLAVILAMSITFLIIGIYGFRKRFA
ncbi:MAG: ABC transporter permease [Anaerolineales bacterium]|nr:ABC transporter permease [Anaerolineales bacterium]